MLTLTSRHERTLTTQIRQEQDQAYAESLAVDQAKAAERAAERDADATRLATELEAQRRDKALKQARIRRQEHWARSLPEPPAPGTPDTVKLSIKLPNSDRHQRVFPVGDSLKVRH